MTAAKPHGVGKLVHGILYLHRDTLGALGEAEQALVREAGRLVGDFPWNVVKLDPERPGRVGLLCYEPFKAAPFPALLESALVDVRAGRVTRRSFQRSANPPILHRKELLLPEGHPDRERYAALTRSLERLGLFVETSRIGFRQTWEARLAAAAVRIVDHCVLEAAPPPASAAVGEAPVERHRTAIARDRLSAPMQILVRHGLLAPERTLLDYGCGQGDDVRTLVAGGFTATGWDPHFAPEAPRDPADIVNLGFVLNVIEEPAERLEALHSAFALARQCLAVAVMLAGKSDTTGLQPYRDGFLTRRGTFQRYFRQDEIKAFIEEALGEEAIGAGPGIFLVFRDKLLEQRFLLGRQRREPVASLATELRPPRERPSADERDLEALRPLLEGLWRRMLELGRAANPSELDPDLATALRRSARGLRRAERLCGMLFAPQALERAASARKDDLRVYFALNLFDGRTRYTALPPELQRDVRAFFGSHTQAIEEARALLFSVGEPAVIKAACEAAYDAGLGWLEEEHALVLATALVPRLPAALRCYIGCAARLFGDLGFADLVRIHIGSGKLTLLSYDGFAATPLPRLRERIKIDLRQQRVDRFDYAESAQVLLMKSRYLAPDLPGYAEQSAFDTALAGLGLFDLDGYGPSAATLEALLRQAGRRVVGFDLTEDAG
jgi:DNA phosphorothioation-associated putative methyltransferase